MSKLYESFVLEWSREEVLPKSNQYGGEKGASSTQLLIEVISDITGTLEDNRAASVLSAIDFSKVFNRLDHEKCLKTFSNKGASTQILALLTAFLSGRKMTVRVGTESSQLRNVNAGAPQGSVLGCYLFNIGVDDLEDEQGTLLPAQEEAHQETLVSESLPSFLSASSRLANASSLLDFSSQSSRSSKKKKPKHQIIPRLTTEAKY